MHLLFRYESTEMSSLFYLFISFFCIQNFCMSILNKHKTMLHRTLVENNFFVVCEVLSMNRQHKLRTLYCQR